MHTCCSSNNNNNVIIIIKFSNKLQLVPGYGVSGHKGQHYIY